MPAPETRPLRVLWIVDSLHEAAETAQIGTFAEATDPSRLRIGLLALRNGGHAGIETTLRRHGVPLRRLGARGPLDPLGFMRLRRSVREGRYDLLHAHRPWASIWGGLVSRLLRLPLVATLYGDPAGPDESRAARRHRRALRVLARWGRRVVVPSGSRWDAYIRDGALPRSILEVVHQGVDVRQGNPLDPRDRTWLRATADFPVGGPISVTLASLDEHESGLDTLLWSIPLIVEAVPQARFVIAGEGAASAELKRRIRARGLTGVVHCLDQAGELPRILSGAELCIQPNLRNPRLDQALTAMAAGLPVVGTRVGGIPEIIGSPDVGRLVPRGDPQALATAIIGLLRDPRGLASMGAAARRRVVHEFSAERWTARMEEIYRDVVRQQGLAGRPRRAGSHARLSVELLGPARRRGAAPSAAEHHVRSRPEPPAERGGRRGSSPLRLRSRGSARIPSSPAAFEPP